jgi:cold shock protein
MPSHGIVRHGIVREYHADEGWGVIDGPEVPGGCWTSFAAVRADGYRALTAGRRVTFVAEPADQDGFPFRAVNVWPGDPDSGPAEPPASSEGYTSSLHLTYDRTAD